MKHSPLCITHSAFCIAALAAFAANAAEPFAIARRGAPFDCAIVVPTNAHECVKYAATELQKYTKRMTGVELPIFDEAAQPPPVKAVILEVARQDAAPPNAGEPPTPPENDNRQPTPNKQNRQPTPLPISETPSLPEAGATSQTNSAFSASPRLCVKKTSPDAFRLHIDGQRLRVTGGGPSGVLYGVYELLERFGGCGWFAPWCEKVPERETFEVPGDLDFSDAPAFDQRTASWLHTIEKNTAGGDAFSAKMRFKHTNGTKVKFGGPGVRYAKGLAWDNGIKAFVSPEKHFEEHPEWFCEIGGRRVGENWQPCCMNRELAAFVAERVKEFFRAEPDADACSVAQMDNGRGCQCAECRAFADEEGSMSGPNILFANRVAEEVEKEFPGKLITTFAYKHTRHAPRHIKPRDNVMVVLCTYECAFSAPFAESSHPNTKRFVADLLAWGRICRNLRIYDYCTNFRNYFYPFPDLMALAPNYRLFRDNGVRWLGSQGGYVHADMAELKCYVQSKLMWNPDQPVMPLVDRFVDGYYGAAAPKVREYLGRLYAAFGIALDDSADPDERPAFGGIYAENLPWLDDAFCADARRLWDEAEEAVKDDPASLSNVRMGKMAVLYVPLKRLYERGWKSVWAAEDIAPHVAALEVLRPLATDFMELVREAGARKRWIGLAEDWGRHKELMGAFGRLAKGDWTTPTGGCAFAAIPVEAFRGGRNKTRRFPIRLIAVDDGAKYAVRARLRPKAPEKPQMGVAVNLESFSAGFDVEWLPKAQGTVRKTFPFAPETERDADGFACYNLGEYDISALQKIPRPTMNGLCLYIQGDVGIDRIEITKVK